MSDDSMYSDGPGGESKEKPHDEAQESDYPVASLPKSILGGKDFKVGDEIVLKITGMAEEDFQVRYAPPKEKEAGKESAGEMEAPAAMGGGGDAEMAGMME